MNAESEIHAPPYAGDVHVVPPFVESLRMRKLLCGVTFYVWLSGGCLSSEPIGDWTFVPEYTLGGQAANHPGPRHPHPKSQHRLIEMEPAAILFEGGKPTQRLINLLPSSAIPREAFTYELWLNHHVNRPVCAMMTVRGREPGSAIPFSIGFRDWESFLVMQGVDGNEVQLRSKLKEYGGFKERWVHLVVTYDGHTPIMYVNGQQVAQGHMHDEALAWPESAELELAAYMQNEPFMQIGNLIHNVRVYDTALAAENVSSRFETLKELVDQGVLYYGLFHYTAGPCLNYVTEDSISLIWETDRPAFALIEWGRTAELGNSAKIENAARLHDFTIEGLESGKPYFYRIQSTDAAGETIDTGLLTFMTALGKGEPFRFAVLGDTEARPHVNDQLAKQIWGERPHFVVNLGDLTDAGETAHRYEWTHEYFVGMTQLFSRIPILAVPGNGESDLHWFKHYHNYPGEENYYQFQYGDAAFFMLDSNRRKEEFKPGGVQYEWLEKQLANCDATWKFVCHHHATFTSEEDDYGDSWKEPAHFGDQFVREIVPLYEKYNVDIAMFGHLHLYERSHPIRNGKVDFENGTMHLLAGGGGGNLEDFAPTPAFFSAKTHRGHHYVTFEVLGDSLSMRMYDADGKVKDWFTIKKDIGREGLKVGRVDLEAATP